MGAPTKGSSGSAPESWSSFPSYFDGAGVARKHGFTSSGSSSTGWRSPKWPKSLTMPAGFSATAKNERPAEYQNFLRAQANLKLARVLLLFISSPLTSIKKPNAQDSRAAIE